MTNQSICIIPARGGSKRIPRKNIKDFFGKPIIEYSIQTALQSEVCDVVMVSTDDDEISKIAQSAGASVPFFRGAETSDDFATTLEVLQDVLKTYRNYGIEFEHVLCLYPIAPLVEGADLIAGKQKLIAENAACVLPVIPFAHPIWRGFRINGTEANYAWPEFADYRSQDLEPIFHDVGQWYWFRSDSLLNAQSIKTLKKSVVVVSEFDVQDVDTAEDWSLLEMKFRIKQGQK